MKRKPKKKFAIFDIDGTIFRSSLVIELTETMIEEGIFSESVRKRYDKEKRMWLDRKGSYVSYIAALVDVFEEKMKGIRSSDFHKAAKIVAERHSNRIYVFTRDLIKSLKKKNYFLMAVSGSPESVVDEFCKNLGFDKVYGRIYEVGNKKTLTGKIIDEDMIRDKSKILSQAVEKYNLTLKGSVGVGDTKFDIPFLRMVENPICFNPNAELYKYAKKKKWRIVAERKDMIYEIK